MLAEHGAITIPETAVGQWAFGKPPEQMAQDFETGYKGTSEMEFLDLSLLQLCLDLDLPNLAYEIEEKLLSYAHQDQNVAAAEALTDVFGEVKAEDRDNLPLVAVFLALRHNIEEASRRRSFEAEQLTSAIQIFHHILWIQLQAIQKRIDEIKTQLETDEQSKAQFKDNLETGYVANHKKTEEVIVFTGKLATDSKQELEHLEEKQMKVLEVWHQLGLIYNQTLTSV